MSSYIPSPLIDSQFLLCHNSTSITTICPPSQYDDLESDVPEVHFDNEQNFMLLSPVPTSPYVDHAAILRQFDVPYPPPLVQLSNQQENSTENQFREEEGENQEFSESAMEVDEEWIPSPGVSSPDYSKLFANSEVDQVNGKESGSNDNGAVQNSNNQLAVDPDEWHNGTCAYSPLHRSPEFPPSMMSLSRSSSSSSWSGQSNMQEMSSRSEQEGSGWPSNCSTSWREESEKCYFNRSEEDEDILELFLGKFNPEEDIPMMMITGLSRENIEDFVKCRLGEEALIKH